MKNVTGEHFQQQHRFVYYQVMVNGLILKGEQLFQEGKI